MPYLLLIHEPVGQRAERTEAEGRAAYQSVLDFSDTLQRRGVLRASSALTGLAQAARVQVRSGVARVVDGPFAEAKEMVGGFFLVDVATRDEAVAIARSCPAAAFATVEVRETGPCYLG